MRFLIPAFKKIKSIKGSKGIKRVRKVESTENLKSIESIEGIEGIEEVKEVKEVKRIERVSYFFYFLFFLGITPSSAWSWDQHKILMPLILKETSSDLNPILTQSAPIPCPEEDQAVLKKLIVNLQLNPQTTVPAITSKKCGPDSLITVYDILTSGTVDDPDLGMDQNLPSGPDYPYDSSGDEVYMGGTSGTSSQGFRHMYFGGWKVLKHPFSTFQIPTRPLGQAPFRFEKMAIQAKELLQSGNLVWGVRLLTWSMHYAQDLTQPFHTAQVLTLEMVPWYALATWPPSSIFSHFFQETTRVITNYHWAYEGYVRDLVAHDQPPSPFSDCLSHPEKYSNLTFDLTSKDPVPLSYQVAENSVDLGSKLGSMVLGFFGRLLRDPGVDFTKNLNLINNTDLAARPDLEEQRSKLHKTTCNALANTSLASRLLIQWAFTK